MVALSSVLAIRSFESLSHHPHIRHFLKGASNLKLSIVHRFPTWDLPKVLDFLTEAPFEPLRSTSLHHLILKVNFLLATTSVRRILELAAFSVRYNLCVFHLDRVILRLNLTFVPKVNLVFHRTQELILPNFCPIEHIDWNAIGIH